MKSENVLIVEDEMIISANLEEALLNLGYSDIECAFNANDAIDALKNKDYNIVLMDVMLGRGIDGIDVVEEIRKIKDLQVIYVTGNSDNQTVDKAKRTLPSGFLTKPVTEHNLKIQLELLLFKQSLSKNEISEHRAVKSIYEGDISELEFTLYSDGTIISVSPTIRKVTGIAGYKYAGMNIATAGIGSDIYNLLQDGLRGTQAKGKYICYGRVFSPFLGDRLVMVQCNSKTPQISEFLFTDITSVSSDGEGLGSIAVASENNDILRGVKGLAAILPGTQIKALISNSSDLKEYLQSCAEGIVLIDVKLRGLRTILHERQKNNNCKIVLMASPLVEQELLAGVEHFVFDGYISKVASDANFVEMVSAIKNNGKYYDPCLNKVLN
jgi:DNA-binding NarL/FixJ family response regulator